ncbi:hypothetical protein Sjap_015288 [Stephania japonica]|uniref:Uncharacterized protein n=1 Tax=Stephania japonica TaxID=461633 RepID=A0AAP0IKF2_9MAGN
MVNKKVQRISKVQKRDEEGVEAAVMEAQMEEKIANLKSLNVLLVKETCKRRKQIDVMAKERAEAEAARFLGEKRVAEEAATKAEEERSMAMVFLVEEVEQLRERVSRVEEEKGREVGLMRIEIEGLRRNVRDLEMAHETADGAIRRSREEELRLKGEMEGVVKEKREQDLEICELKKAVDLLSIDLGRERKGFEVVTRERDEIRKCVDVEKEELRGLRARLHEQGQRNEVVEEELGRVHAEMRGLVEERKEREIAFESLRTEKLLLECKLVESSSSIEDLRGDIVEVEREKGEIEAEKAKQELGIVESQGEVVQLQATLSALKEKENGLCSKIYELRKSNAEALEKQELLRLDFGILVEEKREAEKNVKLLLDEKDLITRSLVSALLQLEEQKRREDGIVHEKAEIEQKSTKQEFELLELSRLQDSVSALEDLCKSHAEEGLNLVGPKLDAIKKTFMSKDEKEEELMKELEVMKNSLKEVHQKKSFWTLMSSATTIVAAASLAYVCSVR